MFFNECLAVDKFGKRESICKRATSCGECIAVSPECAWCKEVGYDENNRDRCDLLDNLKTNGCAEKEIMNPDHNVKYIEDTEVQDATDGRRAVQIQPQHMKIKLRPNKPAKFNVVYKEASDYPVDLYIVMDLSHSMKDDKKKLAELGVTLSQEMKTITKRFRLGFGSFVDKKTMPYVSIVPDRLENPCSDYECAAPYGFKNHLALTDDVQRFKQAVEDAPISGNLDGPEGGFDAVMQAITCDSEIGWDMNSRKMLVYSSDALFHFAGDGKLGGIVIPNDGKCHMENDMYTESLNQDYPSISQLAHKIKKTKVNMIFAVTEKIEPAYKELTKYIEGSAIGILANDSSNVVKLIRNNYEEIRSIVEMKTEKSDDIYVKFRSKCLETRMRDTNKCEKMGVGENVTFEVEIMVEKCPVNARNWKKEFSIYAVGLSEKLKIELDLDCECECEQGDFPVENAAQCSKVGTYECGACSCSDERYGDNCECNKNKQSDSDDLDINCRKNGGKICAGNGQCQCGKCICDAITSTSPEQLYDGIFCDCDNYSCDYHNGEFCGGSTRGTCKCGNCSCHTGWKGKACQCPASDEACYPKKVGDTEPIKCNGRGECECGRCICDINDDYRGPTCEDCPTCKGKCDIHQPCVQCTVFLSGPINQVDCKSNCSHIDIKEKDSIPENPDLRRKCQSIDDDKCVYYFAYDYIGNIVYVQRTKECRIPVDKKIIIVSVVVGIIVFGVIALLIWKCVTTFQDRRELAKFDKDRENAKWDTGENPIYQGAITTFKNPTYTGVN